MEHGASCTCDTCMEKDERLYTVWHDEHDERDEPESDEDGYWERRPDGGLHYHTHDPATEDDEDDNGYHAIRPTPNGWRAITPPVWCGSIACIGRLFG